MANLLLKTEDFSHAAWVNTSVTVTADSTAAPSGFPTAAGLADTAADNSAVVKAGLIQDVTIPGSALNYTFSLFVKKDTDTTRYLQLRLQFRDVAGFDSGVNFDTQNGTFDDPGGIISSGGAVVNYDASWWRIWIREDSGGNTRVQCAIYPAATDVSSSAGNVVTQGSVIIWGANLTQSTVIQTYEPDPAYPAAVPAAIIFRNRLYV